MMLEHIRREIKIEKNVLTRGRKKDFLATKLNVRNVTTREALEVLAEAIAIFENYLLMRSIEKEGE
jgi:hypothetical protein